MTENTSMQKLLHQLPSRLEPRVPTKEETLLDKLAIAYKLAPSQHNKMAYKTPGHYFEKHGVYAGGSRQRGGQNQRAKE